MSESIVPPVAGPPFVDALFVLYISSQMSVVIK